jgi:hypothetical protein
VLASRLALGLGLDVWFSPELWDKRPEETLRYVTGAAGRAAALERAWPGKVVLSVGSELTFFMRGAAQGATLVERLADPALWEAVGSGAHDVLLNTWLAQAIQAARRVFGGRITYASAPLETVDWTPFDIAAVDLYRDAVVTGGSFAGALRPLLSCGRPVAVTEFGCCAYQGADTAGGRGWDIIDYATSPPRLNGTYVRDETVQVRELTGQLAMFEDAGVAAAFAFTYGLTDSPAGQLAWIVEKFKEWTSSAHELPEEAISRDEILTDFSLYWFTGTAGSAANVYYENMHSGDWPVPTQVPTGVGTGSSSR